MEEAGCLPGTGTDDYEKKQNIPCPTPATIRSPDRPDHSLITIPATQSLLATNNLLGTLFANKK